MDEGTKCHLLLLIRHNTILFDFDAMFPEDEGTTPDGHGPGKALTKSTAALSLARLFLAVAIGVKHNHSYQHRPVSIWLLPDLIMVILAPDIAVE